MISQSSIVSEHRPNRLTNTMKPVALSSYTWQFMSLIFFLFFWLSFFFFGSDSYHFQCSGDFTVLHTLNGKATIETRNEKNKTWIANLREESEVMTTIYPNNALDYLSMFNAHWWSIILERYQKSLTRFDCIAFCVGVGLKLKHLNILCVWHVCIRYTTKWR